MTDSVLKSLAASVPGCRFLPDEPMKNHTTFRIGGKARLYCLPETEKALEDVIAFCRTGGVPYMIVGRGSNLLFSDRGFDGAVISSCALDGVAVDALTVRAGGGAMLSRAATAAAEKGLAGLEFAHGIPGSVGGAVYMNAGAYDGEISRAISAVRVLTADGAIRTLSNEEMRFGYRTSVLQETGGVVLSAEFSLAAGDREEIFSHIRELDAKRRDRQPLDRCSAGSFFKRPPGHFAGALIEQAGLKGYSVGDAQVSEKHAGFIVNNGNATCADVLRLKDHVVETVERASGVRLEMEVRLAGDFT